MSTVENSDGLLAHIGNPSQNVSGTTSRYGNRYTIEFTVDFDDLPDDIGGAFHDSDSFIPAGAVVESAKLLTDVAWVGGTSIDIGTYEKDDTVIDADGIDAAIATAALTAGSLIVCDGAQASDAIVSTTADAYIKVAATGTYTAGSSRLVITVLDAGDIKV